jgi:hypothetical protein
MRKHNQEYKMGKVIAYNEEPAKYQIPHFIEDHGVGDGRQKGFRIGKIGVREGEDAGSIEDQSDEQVRQDALQQFTDNIRNIVSAKLTGKKIKLKMKGHKDLVSQITKMIALEVKYLKAIMSGQAADTPMLQKTKAELDKEINVLNRMLAVDDAWPFK